MILVSNETSIIIIYTHTYIHTHIISTLNTYIPADLVEALYIYDEHGVHPVQAAPTKTCTAIYHRPGAAYVIPV